MLSLVFGSVFGYPQGQIESPQSWPWLKGQVTDPGLGLEDKSSLTKMS